MSAMIRWAGASHERRGTNMPVGSLRLNPLLHHNRMSRNLLWDSVLFRAFVFVAVVALRVGLVPAPALAVLDDVWNDGITMHIENDGNVSVVDLRTHYSSSDKRPLVIEWGLVDTGTDFDPATYTELEVGELDANGDLLPYRQAKDDKELQAGDYAIVENGGRTHVVLRLQNPDDSTATYCARYRLAGAVRRWSDTGEVRLRLWKLAQDTEVRTTYVLTFPNDKDGWPADSPTELQTWGHAVSEWRDEDEVCPIDAKQSDGGYAAQDSPYVSDMTEHEIRALFPAELLYKMDSLPQSQGERVRAQENAAAEASAKKRESEREQRELEWNARKSAREQRLAVEEPLFLICTIGVGAYCIYKARRLRREYNQSHLEHVVLSWLRHMFVKYRPLRKKGDPEEEGVGDVMFSDDVHPLVLGWALTGGQLAYSAIVATLARLSTFGVVEIKSVYTAKSMSSDGPSLLSSVYDDASGEDWMLVFHREKFGLVSDSLDRAVLEMFEELIDAASDAMGGASKRSFVGTDQGECFLLSDMSRIIGWHTGKYMHSLQRLRVTIRETCHEQGLDDDQATLDKRRLLKILIALYACVLVAGTVVVLADVSVTVLATPILALAVFSYLLDSYTFLVPLSKKAVQLRSELGRLRLWLHDLDAKDDEVCKALDAQGWQLVLERALVLGEDDKAADRLRLHASTFTHNAGVRSLLTWCGKPAWGVIWAFEDATRRATRVRGVTPAPSPRY